MTEKEIVIDRAFDAACVAAADPQWSQQIYERLCAKYPQNVKFIDGLVNLYKEHLSNGAEYCICRRDYMLTNKAKMRLRFS